MKKWEYLEVNQTALPISEYADSKFDGKWREKYLDYMGKEGWELCGVTEIYFYFKRQITTN